MNFYLYGEVWWLWNFPNMRKLDPGLGKNILICLSRKIQFQIFLISISLISFNYLSEQFTARQQFNKWYDKEKFENNF